MNTLRSASRKRFVAALAIHLVGLNIIGSGFVIAAGDPASQGPLAPATGQAAREVFTALQACSYDGSAIALNVQGMSEGQAGSGTEVVADIMRYTGLPQNFEVLPHPEVPNAAAVIVVGPDKLPKRVIAYNENFMKDVRAATANNDWAPVSIMAHEIGHHLSGHTIQPGGSQPATELEADKFSGFVLYKMGAQLGDATKAINTLVPEQDGPTHPGRPKRVSAIEDGWHQACQQQSSDCSGTAIAKMAEMPDGTTEPAGKQEQKTAAIASPEPPADKSELTVQSQPRQSEGIGQKSQATTTAQMAAHAAVDVLPPPDAKVTPAKFGKFVIDEMGVLDPAMRGAFEQKMFDLAAKHQVEIVTIITKNLHGLSADAYASAMMRQLRVGKLDVGNGTVLVVAPNENEVGVVMGPGIMLEMRDYIDLEKDRLKSFIEISLPYCKGICSADQTDLLFESARHIGHDVSFWNFNITYQSLGELMAQFEKTMQARMDGADISPENDPSWRKISRIEGKIVSRDPATGDQAKWLNEIHVQRVGMPVHAVTADGRNLLLYLNPQTEQLMTSTLVEGQSYIFIAREASLGQNPEDTLSFDLLSYDLVR